MVRLLMAGIKIITIKIITKFSTITSVDGAAPRNIPAKIIEKINIYKMAREAVITIYEKNFSQIELRLSER